MIGTKIFSAKMSDAEKARYNKIYRLTTLLCSQDNDALNTVIEKTELKPFKVGRRITVDGENIYIKNKLYCAYQLQKITINTEGSLCIYDRNGKKLCDWKELNLSSANIELFCIWARKCGVPAEAVSGKRERAFQLFVLTLAILLVLLVKILK